MEPSTRTSREQWTLPFTFSCLECSGPLVPQSATELCCPADGLTYHQEDGIWRFIGPQRLETIRRFTAEYETIRKAEGRVSADGSYYQQLPSCERSDPRAREWALRGRGFRTFCDKVLPRIETGTSLTILDLGAGNGWLSNRLAARGHTVAAVDLIVNSFDGLGACRHYLNPFVRIQADYHVLPLLKDQFDLAIFNGSLHYTHDYEAALSEVLRVLRVAGRIAVMDSPIYRSPQSGRRMVAERECHFRSRYGFPSDSLNSENFLTWTRLAELEDTLGIEWEVMRPRYGIRWLLRSLKARLFLSREPAKFRILLGRRRNPNSPGPQPRRRTGK